MRLHNPLNGAHGHWSAQAKARRSQKWSVRKAWLLNRLPREYREGMRVRITRVGKRALDSDNLQAACKAVRDAAAEMLGIDDRLEIWDYGQQTGDYAVRIELTVPPGQGEQT